MCSSIVSGELISETISASSSDEAEKLFFTSYSVKSLKTLGPFLKKNTSNKVDPINLKFSNQTKRAVFNNWMVTAFLLKEPDKHAYLVFNRHMNDKNEPIPTGTTIVSISDLRFI